MQRANGNTELNVSAMVTVASIVEGNGEVAAVPVLLRRLAAWLTPQTAVQPSPPIRVRRDRFLHREEDFRKYVLLASAKAGKVGWILIILDADDDCPAALAPRIAEQAKTLVGHTRVSVVLPAREFEAWFIASGRSLDGKRGFNLDAVPADPEIYRDAKGWLHARMKDGYRQVTDQPAFSAGMDLEQARANSRSFRKLCDDWLRHCEQVRA
jgi:hypothetical protein